MNRRCAHNLAIIIGFDRQKLRSLQIRQRKVQGLQCLDAIDPMQKKYRRQASSDQKNPRRYSPGPDKFQTRRLRLRNQSKEPDDDHGEDRYDFQWRSHHLNASVSVSDATMAVATFGLRMGKYDCLFKFKMVHGTKATGHLPRLGDSFSRSSRASVGVFGVGALVEGRICKRRRLRSGPWCDHKSRSHRCVSRGCGGPGHREGSLSCEASIGGTRPLRTESDPRCRPVSRDHTLHKGNRFTVEDHGRDHFKCDPRRRSMVGTGRSSIDVGRAVTF